MRQPQGRGGNILFLYIHASVGDVRSERRGCTAQRCQAASCAIAQQKASAIIRG